MAFRQANAWYWLSAGELIVLADKTLDQAALAVPVFTAFAVALAAQPDQSFETTFEFMNLVLDYGFSGANKLT